MSGHQERKILRVPVFFNPNHTLHDINAESFSTLSLSERKRLEKGEREVGAKKKGRGRKATKKKEEDRDHDERAARIDYIKIGLLEQNMAGIEFDQDHFDSKRPKYHDFFDKFYKAFMRVYDGEEMQERLTKMLNEGEISFFSGNFPSDFTQISPEQYFDLWKQAIKFMAPKEQNYDFYYCDGTPEAVSSAMIAASYAVYQTFEGQQTKEFGPCAFAAVRPPSHHALLDQAKGFCFGHNTLVAACVAQDFLQPMQNVLVLDIDYHFGQGIALAIEKCNKDSESKIYYFSVQVLPKTDDSSGAWFDWPHKGEEYLKGDISKYAHLFQIDHKNRDIKDSDDFVRHIMKNVKKYANKKNIQAIIVAAGFDNSVGEAMAQQAEYDDKFKYSGESIQALGRSLRDWAKKRPLVSILEGGYNRETMEIIVPLYIGATLGIENDASKDVRKALRDRLDLILAMQEQSR